jgi:hypothetical protein
VDLPDKEYAHANVLGAGPNKTILPPNPNRPTVGSVISLAIGIALILLFFVGIGMAIRTVFFQ